MPNLYEILIIGGGVIGLSIARELHKRGIKNIAIVERGDFGKEASFAAAGMLAPQVEADSDDDFFHFCLESNRIYRNFVSELFEETGIDAEFDEQGTLLIAFNEDDLLELKKRYEWQKKQGLSIELLDSSTVKRLEPFISPDALQALFFPDNCQVENRKLVLALKEYARLNHINLFANTEISDVLVDKSNIIAETRKNDRVGAKIVILAAGAFSSLIRINGMNLFKVKPIRGQMISFHTSQRFFKHVIYSQRGYIVPRRDGRILVGATVEDVGFDKNVTKTGVNFLSQIGTEIAPALSNLKIYEKWAGLRPFVEDGLPIIGQILDFENLFIATGHYRNGILLAPLTAKILADKITENVESKYLRKFSPERFL